MPPPNYKLSRAYGDRKQETSKYESVSEASSDDEFTEKTKNHNISLVKSLLGPSLEDAVLRTLEFGKSLIQKSNETSYPDQGNKHKKSSKSIHFQTNETPYSDDYADEDFSPRKYKLYSKYGEDEEIKKVREPRSNKKRIVFTANIDKEISYFAKEQNNKKVKKVAKIRSLDSDLKQLTPSPEKIKRQLEALIQINKDEPPECARPWAFHKTPLEFTIMPSMCTYGKDGTLSCVNPSDPSEKTKISGSMEEGKPKDPPRPSMYEKISVKEPPNTFELPNTFTNYNQNPPNQSEGSRTLRRAAPKFLTNALGPTIDVSIIENLKIVRDLLKCEPGKTEEEEEGGEKTGGTNGTNGTNIPTGPTGPVGPTGMETRREEGQKFDPCQMEEPQIICFPPVDPDPCGGDPQIPDLDLRLASARFEELQKKICELELREKCLQKQIQMEELERAAKRKAFEEEERRRKNCVSYKDSIDTRIKLSSEEERLYKLKNQCEVYQREILEARIKRENLRRNKSLLDAWDVIASRVCHTKLPPFSRLYTLERKSTKPDRPGDIHCCLINPQSKSFNVPPCGSGFVTTQQSQNCMGNLINEMESIIKLRSQKQPDIPFPLQRDVTCGLHQTLKLCVCGGDIVRRIENPLCSTDDEFLKRIQPKKCEKPVIDVCKSSAPESVLPKPIEKCLQKSFEKCVEKVSERYLGKIGDKYTRKPSDKCIKPVEKCPDKPMEPCAKNVNRSRSDTLVRRDKNSKILKVMWAVTRINIFQDNVRTYEVMDATTIPPLHAPAKTEGIFVVKNARKKLPNSPRRT